MLGCFTFVLFVDLGFYLLGGYLLLLIAACLVTGWLFWRLCLGSLVVVFVGGLLMLFVVNWLFVLCFTLG